MSRKCRNLLIAGMVAAAIPALPAFAQGYPAKPVRILVGFAPGGGTDIMARTIAAKLTDSMKQQFVVENRPGANANLAAKMAADAPGDGYTVLFCSVSTHAIWIGSSSVRTVLVTWLCAWMSPHESFGSNGSRLANGPLSISGCAGVVVSGGAR